MEDYHHKVFSSEITRTQHEPGNNLYELLYTVPAKPIIYNNVDHRTCDFRPKEDKYYIPKKKSRLKVKTVRDIRSMFENDVNSYLPKELEQQENILLEKIKTGLADDKTTKTLAKNLLESSKPLSKQVWQMLINLNPYEHKKVKQYVLWNGKYIQVNGSTGGKKGFIINRDLGQIFVNPKNKSVNKYNVGYTKLKLLRNTLKTKFKPGPLTKKKYLDQSYQKYHIGEVKLVELPKLGLTVQPTYGIGLDSITTLFLNNLRDDNGLISDKWAEFAVSVLGTCNKSNVVQLSDKCVTFDLKYQCNQNKVLMRQNNNDKECTVIDYDNIDLLKTADTTCEREIERIMERILVSVEISLQQDTMLFFEDNEQINVNPETECVPLEFNNMREKAKRKYCELNRLNVTVIRLDENSVTTKTCQNTYCALGCICASLKCDYKIKEHCGQLECMFECTCDFFKNQVNNSYHLERYNMTPNLTNKLNEDLNSKLSKEEQKFHQTVILRDNQDIILNSQKRNFKAESDFEITMDMMNVAVNVLKINYNNVEPWCMAHNVYKCYCKGKFIESSIVIDTEEKLLPKENNLISDKYLQPMHENNNKPIDEEMGACKFDNYRRFSNINYCARTIGYKYRKHDDRHYSKINKKIFEMEEKDINIKRKLNYILNQCEKYKIPTKTTKSLLKRDIKCYKKKEILQTPSSIVVNEDKSENNQQNFVHNSNVSTKSNVYDISSSSSENFDEIKSSSPTKTVNKLHKNKLVEWLEANYKKYKQVINKGNNLMYLPRPDSGKMALFPWGFILSRYRERKNLFFISKEKPFRLYMAVDKKHVFFQNCLNIDEIGVAALNKYPIVVKNLLINENNTHDSFCILCGMAFCWEIIGSVSKVNNTTVSDEHILESNDSCLNKSIVSNEDTLTEVFPEVNEHAVNVETDTEVNKFDNNVKTSKWFLMTIENDFREINFPTKGFFVKFETIINALNVAQKTGQTVRLSSRNCENNDLYPQFGIYALPNMKCQEKCVFVGPYEINESLDITTIKNVLDIQNSNRTRGVWIQTDKMNNLNVIHNPTSFMLNMKCNEDLPSLIVDKDNMKKWEPVNLIIIDDFPTLPYLTFQTLPKNDMNKLEEAKDTKVDNTVKKTVKPIKIRKSNGYYHLASSGLKSMSVPKPQIAASWLLQNTSLLKKPNILHQVSKSKKQSPIISPLTNLPQKPFGSLRSAYKKPVAEIAPHIKITAVYSTNQTANSKGENAEKGMFILNPEEINKRLINGMVNKSEVALIESENKVLEQNTLEEDIEKFIVTSSVCNAPKDDILIISDEEDAIVWKNVWIQCINIKNIGWLPGRRNKENFLSFKFPGFKFSEFYEEDLAFVKINEVLSRKVYVPEHIHLKWKVVEKKRLLGNNESLKRKYLNQNYVVTTEGLQHRNEYKKKVIKVKTYSRKQISDVSPSTSTCSFVDLSDSEDSTEQTTIEATKQDLLTLMSASENDSHLIKTIVSGNASENNISADVLQPLFELGKEMSLQIEES